MTQSLETINPDMDLSNLRYLMNHIVKTINLPDFVESETGDNIFWVRPEVSAKCCCPLHEEGQASFNMNWINDEVWVYHCFGCQAKGNVIHFCRDFHGLRNKLEAIYYICKKYNIENTSDLILQGIQKVSVKIDEQRMIENANILVSNQCRMLLRKNFDLHKKWVAIAYRDLNVALKNNHKSEIDKISEAAYRRIHMKEEGNE